MGEKTLIKTMELPPGQHWIWFDDANVIAVSDSLDEAGWRRAVDAAEAHAKLQRPQLPPSRTPNGNVVSDRLMA